MAGGRYSERGVGYRDEQHAISETPVSGPDSPDAAAAAATACLHSLHQEFCPGSYKRVSKLYESKRVRHAGN